MDGWRKMAESIGVTYVMHIEEDGWEYSPEIRASAYWTRKADILRLEIMARFGGVYVDADIQNVSPLPDDLFAAPWLVYENEEETPLVGNHAMGLSRGSPLALEALSLIRAGREGIVAFATGPGLITEVLVKHPTRILPARAFAPLYFNGGAAHGDGPVYGQHVWASTRDQYGKLEMPRPLVRGPRQEMAHKMRMAGLRKVYPTDPRGPGST
jgi:Glycosyltransferase sugar-binding region containing DXD motif